MTNHYVEVKLPKDGNGKSKLVGLHEVSGKSKPSPAWGGDECLPITNIAYDLLHATNGSIETIIQVGKALDEWLESE